MAKLRIGQTVRLLKEVRSISHPHVLSQGEVAVVTGFCREQEDHEIYMLMPHKRQFKFPGLYAAPASAFQLVDLTAN